MAKRGRAARPPDSWGQVWFHPQRGAVVVTEAVNPGCMRYRGGNDGDWRDVARVKMTSTDRHAEPMRGERLPAGFLWGDPAKQAYGMGGPEQIYGPLEKRCRDCGNDFVFTARAQQQLYETLGVFIDVTAVRCRTCARKRRDVEAKRVAYAAAIHAAEGATTAKPLLALARATLALVQAGGRGSLDRAIACCRKARRLGAAADALEAALVALRAARGA